MCSHKVCLAKLSSLLLVQHLNASSLWYYRAEKTEVLSEDLLQVRWNQISVNTSCIHSYIYYIYSCFYCTAHMFHMCLFCIQVEKRLDLVKQVSHSTHKKLTACLQGQQGTDLDKKAVKSPLVHQLSHLTLLFSALQLITLITVWLWFSLNRKSCLLRYLLNVWWRERLC